MFRLLCTLYSRHEIQKKVFLFSDTFRHIHRQFTSCRWGWSVLPQLFCHTGPVDPVWGHTPRRERRLGWLGCTSPFSPAGRRLCSSGGLFPSQPTQSKPCLIFNSVQLASNPSSNQTTNLVVYPSYSPTDQFISASVPSVPNHFLA